MRTNLLTSARAAPSWPFFDPNLNKIILNSGVANLNATYNIAVEIVTFNPLYATVFHKSAQTITFTTTPVDSSNPPVVDFSGLENGWFWLENVDNTALELLAYLEPNTQFDLTISKNGQSYTISGLKIGRTQDEAQINGPVYYPPGSNDSNIYFSDTGRIDVNWLNLPEGFSQTALNSFISTNGISTYPGWGFINDSNVTVTFTIPEQDVLLPGLRTIKYPAVVTLSLLNEIDGMYVYEVNGVSETDITQAGLMYTFDYEAGDTNVLMEGFIPIVEESASVTNLVTVNGKAVGLVSANPTATEVLVNGQPLAAGSVLKNSTTGQKFMKVEGNSKAFKIIPITPPAEWGWSEAEEAAWEVLQNI